MLLGENATVLKEIFKEKERQAELNLQLEEKDVLKKHFASSKRLAHQLLLNNVHEADALSHHLKHIIAS